MLSTVLAVGLITSFECEIQVPFVGGEQSIELRLAKDKATIGWSRLHAWPWSPYASVSPNRRSFIAYLPWSNYILTFDKDACTAGRTWDVLPSPYSGDAKKEALVTFECREPSIVQRPGIGLNSSVRAVVGSDNGLVAFFDLDGNLYGLWFSTSDKAPSVHVVKDGPLLWDSIVNSIKGTCAPR